MGTTTNAILAYGFNLGGTEEWKIQEVPEYEDFKPSWRHEGEDLVDAIERVLLADAGFTEDDWRVGGYFERQREAWKAVGLTLVTHCSDEYPMWLLAAHTVESWRGDATAVDWADLERRRIAEDWDGRLRKALTTLGMTPLQAEPAWLLVSYWG